MSRKNKGTLLQKPLPEPTPEDYAFSRLIAYAAYQWPGYRDAKHHRLIARKLEALERGEFDRLMIFMPPRHGKSMLASEFFPAWYLGRNPNHYVIAATYAQELADDFGRKVRDQIADPAFKGIFPGVSIKSDSTAAKRFHVEGPSDAFITAQDGAYFAVGVGGPLTGRGAHLMLIDDPVKNREEADSETVRRKTKDWYTSTAYTRLMPGGKIVVIQTRWHQDDLSGWLLKDHQHEGWEVLDLPAIDAQNEALWPDQYPINALEKIRLAVGPRDWSALYQQRPVPDTGDYFKAEWIKTVDVLPPRATLSIYGGSDYAVTSNGGDYTVHVVVGIDPEGRMYLLDLWRGQASSDVWIEAFCDLVLKWRPIGWAEETGQIKSGVGPFLTKRMMERRTFTVREAFPTRGDKAVRAQSIRGRMAMQGLYVPVDAPWRADLHSELMSFPVGVHDDQCLAEGTLITMADGSEKAIEHVKIGDEVSTPMGPCAVTASAVTNEAAQVYRVRTSCGREIVATGNHPVFVEGRGFVRVDELGMMDQLRLEPSCSADQARPRLRNTKGSVIGAIRTASTLITASISTGLSQGAGFFTGTSGKTALAPFRMGMTSTTRTRTPATTIRSILNALPSWSIGAGTRLLATRLRETASCSIAFAARPLSGTQVQKGWPGIAPTAQRHGWGASGIVTPRFVSPVPLHSMQRLSGQGFVHAAASNAGRVAADRSADDILVKAKRWLASAAIESFLPTGRIQQRTAPKPAGCVTGIEALSERARVRNLTVSRAHVFYANGILTHNCDALGLVGQLLDRMTKGQPVKPPPDRKAQPTGTVFLPGAPEPVTTTRKNWG